MPERKTLQRAQRDRRAGKAPSTQAGEFVREEMHHIRAGKHGARSPQQAIAIGLSKARRAGAAARTARPPLRRPHRPRVPPDGRRQRRRRPIRAQAMCAVATPAAAARVRPDRHAARADVAA
jgi:hypothetical protein